MMHRLTLLFVWLLTLGLYLVIVLWSLPNLAAFAGGLTMFDLRPAGYTYTEAIEVLEALGPAGRDAYLNPQHLLDTAYPPLLALALTLSYLRLFSLKPAIALAILAVAACAFDLLENQAVAAMLTAGPSGTSPEMAAIANRWTLAKTALVSAGWLALLAGLFRLGWRRLRPSP